AVAVAHHSRTVDTYRTGARCALHWHVNRMVVGHGNSVLIVNSARGVRKATEVAGPPAQSASRQARWQHGAGSQASPSRWWSAAPGISFESADATTSQARPTKCRSCTSNDKS